MTKKWILTSLIASSFFFSGLHAIRTNPRIGRTTWRVLRDATLTPIEMADEAPAGSLIIDVPGNYQLYEDITDLQVQITSDDVFLDLNSYEISHSAPTAPIFQITGNNVHVCNGIIRQTAGTLRFGLYINAANSVLVEQVDLFDCDIGIVLNGASECTIVDCNTISCQSGVYLFNSDNNIIKDCATASCLVGMGLVLSDQNRFVGCSANNTTRSGFALSGCESNILQNCSALKTVG